MYCNVVDKKEIILVCVYKYWLECVSESNRDVVPGLTSVSHCQMLLLRGSHTSIYHGRDVRQVYVSNNVEDTDKSKRLDKKTKRIFLPGLMGQIDGCVPSLLLQVDCGERELLLVGPSSTELWWESRKDQRGLRSSSKLNWFC